MQCTYIWAAFPGESIQHYPAFLLLLLFPPVCSVFIFPTYFTTDEYRIFNMRTNLSLCHTHEWGSGTNMSAQELTQRYRKLSLTLSHQEIEPIVFGFKFQHCNNITIMII